MESEVVLTSEISLVSRNQEIKLLEAKIEEIQAAVTVATPAVYTFL